MSGGRGRETAASMSDAAPALGPVADEARLQPQPASSAG